jgi:hypothetical protein
MRKLLPMICQDGPIDDLTKAFIDSVDDNGVEVAAGHLCQVVRIKYAAKVPRMQ